jgi:natural product precursor
METKKISLNGIKEILSNNEMKNVKGGSFAYCWCGSTRTKYVSPEGRAYEMCRAYCNGSCECWY